MEACIEAAVPSRPKEFDARTISRMLTHSRAIPLALLLDGRFAFANPAFTALFRATGGVIGMTLPDLLASRSHAALSKLLSATTTEPVTLLGRALRLDGSSFDVEILLARETLDSVSTICVLAEDVTWRKISDSNLSYLAYTDALTGLPNRALVFDRLRDALCDAKAGKSRLAVLMADLDGLKRVNDTLGHQAGDIVLQVTARRFLECVRDSDTLARLGGDEFCIMLPGMSNVGDAECIAARLVEAARQPISIDGRDVCVGASVGIALFPDHGSTGDAVVAAADAALYVAKEDGRNRYAWASVPRSTRMFQLPVITWTPAHDVGIAMMDEQHRQLAEHVNDLAGSLKRDDEQSAIAVKLATTLSFARFHFQSEERLMDRHGFADAAAHREIHAHLLDDLVNFSMGYDTRSLSLITRFLQEWLLRHIESADRDLARALTARGVH